MRRFARLSAMVIAVACAAHPVDTLAQVDPAGYCVDPLPRPAAPDAYAIAEAVFIDKFARNHDEGLIDNDFFQKVKDLRVVLCAEDSFEAVGYEDGTVVVDRSLLEFFYHQAHALIVGGYLARARGPEKSFLPYDSLLGPFFAGDYSMGGNAASRPIERAAKEGLSPEVISGILADPAFQIRVQNLFLVMLYFLAAHEACHYVLEHHGDPSRESEAVRFAHEREADACALRLINVDEKRFQSSPIAFFGAIAVVGSQAMFAEVSEAPQTSHPSSRDRFQRAYAIMREYIGADASSPQKAAVYSDTVDALAAYFDSRIKR